MLPLLKLNCLLWSFYTLSALFSKYYLLTSNLFLFSNQVVCPKHFQSLNILSHSLYSQPRLCQNSSINSHYLQFPKNDLLNTLVHFFSLFIYKWSSLIHSSLFLELGYMVDFSTLQNQSLRQASTSLIKTCFLTFCLLNYSHFNLTVIYTPLFTFYLRNPEYVIQITLTIKPKLIFPPMFCLLSLSNP